MLVVLALLAAPLTCLGLGDEPGAGVRPPVVVAAEVAEIRRALAPQIAAAQGKYRVPGISLALVRGDRTLWLEGFGQADKASGAPAAPDTVFRAGSLAKPFTALAVLQLAERGALDIDQPIEGYLPELAIRSRFDASASPVTVRSLLCHHGGLPTDLNKGMWTDAPFQSVAGQLGQEHAAFPPFLVLSYSNVGYTLLGHMVEKVAGVPYRRYMREHLFRPLVMPRTGFDRDDRAPPHAVGYRKGRPLALLPIRDLPAHGLYTTAADLGAFLRALLSGEAATGEQIVSRETLEEMLEPQNADVPLDLGLLTGLGWFLEDDALQGAGRTVRHGGTTLGFAAELVMLPDHGLGVAVLANADGSRFLVSRLAEEILTRVLAGAEAPAPPTERFLADLDRQSDGAVTAEIEGDYATDFGLISIKAGEAEVCACMIGETLDLIPYPNGWFGIGRDAGGALPTGLRRLAGMRLQTRVLDGREVVVARKGEKETVLGEKVPDTRIPDAWLARVGRYELVNPDPGFPVEGPEIRLNNGQLCMRYRMPRLSPKVIQVPVRPISDKEAVILGLGRTRGETLYGFTAEGEQRVRYSGFVGRRLPNLDQK